MTKNHAVLADELREVPGLTDADAARIALATGDAKHLELAWNSGVAYMVARRIAAWYGVPLRAPHHTVSLAGLVGSARCGTVRPGEIGAAAGGFLLIDDAFEWRRDALRAIAEAVLKGRLPYRFGGASFVVELPAPIRVIVHRRPCPCGLRGSVRHAGCKCTPRALDAARARLDGFKALLGGDIATVTIPSRAEAPDVSK